MERIPAPRSDDLGHPDAAFHLIGELLAFDHWRQRLTVIVNVAVDGLGRRRGARRATTARARGSTSSSRRSRPPRAFAPFELPAPSRPLRRSRRRRTARRRTSATPSSVAKEHIVAGDVFQVVLSQRFDCDARGRAASPSTAPCGSSTRARTCTSCASTACTVLGSSPEALVRLRDGVATMRPIAGSRPRGGTDRRGRAARRRARRGPEGARRARDARRPRAQRPRPGLRLRVDRRSTSS